MGKKNLTPDKELWLIPESLQSDGKRVVAKIQGLEN